MKDLSEVIESIKEVDPFERFATSYFSQDNSTVMKKIRQLRLQRLEYMKEKEPVAKKAKGNGTTVKRTSQKKVKDPMDELAKLLKKVSQKQLDSLKLAVKQLK